MDPLDVMSDKEVSGEDPSSEEDAAKDMLAAIKRNDAKALSLAMKRHYEACEASDSKEPNEDDTGGY